MSKEKPRDLAASVQRRLLNIARERGEEFQLVLTRYVIERLLYRLSRSPHRKEFALKGAMLFCVWTDHIHRPTRDLDLWGRKVESVERLVEVLQAVCSVAVEDDAVVFDPASARGERIREDQQYEGVRLRCQARLGPARVDVQIDVGFGDAVTPKVMELEFPVLLKFPAPALLAYPQQTVVAEKYQAMVALGISNSRMKDFFDLWVLAHEFAFEGPTLTRAIEATFERRKTPLVHETPLALTAEFGRDAMKLKQWQAFLRKGKLDADRADLAEVCSFLQGFLMPPTQALASGREFKSHWPPAGPWREAADG